MDLPAETGQDPLPALEEGRKVTSVRPKNDRSKCVSRNYKNTGSSSFNCFTLLRIMVYEIARPYKLLETRWD
jgi:hypothetical protein